MGFKGNSDPCDLHRIMCDLEIRCYSVPWNLEVAFCVLGKVVGPIANQQMAVVSNLQLEVVKEGEELKPTFKLRRDNVQALMDELYRVGFSPSEQGTTGELSATKVHLQDMRTIVAAKLEIPKLIA